MPTKLTPKTHKTIVTHVIDGVYLETAAAAAGIAKRTLYDWLSRPGAGHRQLLLAHTQQRRYGRRLGDGQQRQRGFRDQRPADTGGLPVG